MSKLLRDKFNYDPKAKIDLANLKRLHPQLNDDALVDLDLARDAQSVGHLVAQDLIDHVFFEMRCKQLDIFKNSFAGNTTLETCMITVNEHLMDADNRFTPTDTIGFDEED